MDTIHKGGILLLDLAYLTSVYEDFLIWANQQVLIVSNLVQLAMIGLIFILAKVLTKKLKNQLQFLLEKIEMVGTRKIVNTLRRLILPIFYTIFLWIYVICGIIFSYNFQIINGLADILSAWIVASLVSTFLKNKTLARIFTVFVWIIATLNILGIYDKAVLLFDSWSLTIGDFSISALTVIEASILFAILFGLARKLTRFLDAQVREISDLTPSIRVLLIKVINFVIFTIAGYIVLISVGINLSALTVLGGAIGLGIGFGLQKVVSNYISGIIILLDKSVKPGDVIEIGNVYGWITALNLRFVSVVTREGKEYLIPNEDFITQKVINWSYSDNLVMVKIHVGVSYDADVEKAMELVVQAAQDIGRIENKPEPICLLTGFGDSSINLELRFWIRDPQNGIANIQSKVFLAIWRLFKVNDIEIPYPQRDLHIKTSSAGEKLAE